MGDPQELARSFDAVGRRGLWPARNSEDRVVGVPLRWSVCPFPCDAAQGGGYRLDADEELVELGVGVGKGEKGGLAG